MGWGSEVALPTNFEYGRSRATFREWAALGVKLMNEDPYPADTQAILLFPSGAAGPSFLVTENFMIIKRYNNSDAYALAVGHLADRLRGLGLIRGAWPSNDRQMTRDERIQLQNKLKEFGYAVYDFEGHIDFALRDAIRGVQMRLGLRPDGHPTSAMLDQMNRTKR